MNDFLAKPIDIDELGRKLDRWVPAALAPTREEIENIVDVEAAIQRLGGDQQCYHEAVESFIKKGKLIDTLRKTLSDGNHEGAGNLMRVLVTGAAQVGAKSLEVRVQAMMQAFDAEQRTEAVELNAIEQEFVRVVRILKHILREADVLTETSEAQGLQPSGHPDIAGLPHKRE